MKVNHTASPLLVYFFNLPYSRVTRIQDWVFIPAKFLKVPVSPFLFSGGCVIGTVGCLLPLVWVQLQVWWDCTDASSISLIQMLNRSGPCNNLLRFPWNGSSKEDRSGQIELVLCHKGMTSYEYLLSVVPIAVSFVAAMHCWICLYLLTSIVLNF